MEYPKSKSAGGPKRLPTNPVYSVGIETGSGNITLENKPTIFRFHPQQGLLDSEKLTDVDKKLPIRFFVSLSACKKKP